MTDVSPCPDCGAAPAWSRCECDFVGVRAKRKHEQRIAELEAEVERLKSGRISTDITLGVIRACDRIIARHKRVLTKALAHFAKKREARRRAITALMAVNERLRADGERLDWIITELNRLDVDTDHTGMLLGRIIAGGTVKDDIYENPRAAIDAARK